MIHKYDYSKLNGKIVEVFGTKKKFAQSMNLSEKSISVTDSQARVKAEASQSTDNGSGTDKSMDSSSQTSEAKNHESSFIAQASLENLVVANG
ncbi:DUF739 family protein [Streptococcus thermophilus]|uniref:DUF739 family protein n=1 Tax=Streptococcus thermophilus TaxID=1308 RepID=UPI00355C3EF2